MKFLSHRVLRYGLAFSAMAGMLASIDDSLAWGRTWYVALTVVICAVMSFTGGRDGSANPHAEASVAELAAVILFRCDSARRLLYANRAAGIGLGLSHGELLGKAVDEILEADVYQRVRGQLEEVLAGRRVEQEYEIPLKQIGMRRIHAVYEPETARDGSTVGFVAIWHDVTARAEAERAPHAGELRYREMTEALPHMIWVMRPDLTVEFLNERSTQFTGFGAEQLNAVGWKRLVHPDDLAAMLDVVTPSLQRGEPHDVQYRLRRRDGEYRWVHSFACPRKNEAGEVLHWVGATHDVHERKLVEQGLKEREFGFRQLADAMPQIVWVTDAAGKSEYRNERWFEYTGLPPNSQEVDDWKKVVHPDDVPLMNAAWAEAARNGRPIELEFRLRRHDAETYRWFLARSVPIRDDSGNILRWFGTSTDIDDQRRVQARIQAGEQIYRAIGESIDYGVWVCDAAGRNTYASPSFLKLVGLSQEECSEFGWGAVLHPDDAERTISAWKRCVREQGRWDVEHRFRGIDGEWHHILARGVPVRDAEGKVSCWVGINLDIGDLKNAERSLRDLNATLERRVAERTAAAERRALALAASEQELRSQSLVMQSILNSMGEGVIVADGGGAIVLQNRTAEELHGPVPAAILGQNWSTAYRLYLPDGRAPFPHEELPLSKALRGEPSDDVELLVRTPSNAAVVLNVTGRPMRSDNGEIQGGVVVFRDVTSRNATLEQLRESEERFRSAFDFAAIGMSLVALDGRWLRVNRSLCELVGYTEQELLASRFQSITHPDDLEVDLDHVRRLVRGEIRGYQTEKRYVHKEGRVIDILLSVSLVRNAAGEPLYFVSQIHDLTRQKAAENEHRQALLRSRFVEQSIAAREDEQRRIARDLHDGIGQSLTSLRLGMRVIEQAADLATARAAASQLRKMVTGALDEVRTLTRNLRPSVLDDLGLVPALRRLADDFTAAYDLRIRIRTESVVDVRFADVVETALYRIVQEALTNVAKHAAATSAEITLRREAEKLCLTVTDDGVGFDPAAPIRGGGCFGILGMRERTALLNGDFELSPGAEGGTILRASIPLGPCSAAS